MIMDQSKKVRSLVQLLILCSDLISLILAQSLNCSAVLRTVRIISYHNYIIAVI